MRKINKSYKYLWRFVISKLNLIIKKYEGGKSKIITRYKNKKKGYKIIYIFHVNNKWNLFDIIKQVNSQTKNKGTK